MPKARKAENKGVPARWRVQHGAYYYQAPPGHERYRDFKQLYRLGKTFDEALERFREVGGRLHREDIPADKLLDTDGITCSAYRIAPCGIYFLIQAGEVVYVGRSANILRRIAQHISTGAFGFDGISTIAADEGFEMERLEQLYIARLAPKHNIRHRQKYTMQSDVQYSE